jgi:hypothetical protein
MHTEFSTEIRELGDQFRLKMLEGWVNYLAAAGEGQSLRQMPDTGPAKRMIIGDNEQFLPGTWNAGLRLGGPFGMKSC